MTVKAGTGKGFFRVEVFILHLYSLCLLTRGYGWYGANIMHIVEIRKKKL